VRPGPGPHRRLPAPPARQLPHATPDTRQRRFLDTPGEIITTSTGSTVKINRRAYSPVLREASLPADTTVPWWNGRQLHFEFA
jgi:hypothetical protein